MTVITLLTDFGISEYPAMIKGVILDRNPGVDIVDITHAISPQNVLQGSFVLENTVGFFPKGTIHVGVVDPGVGTSRKSIAIECRDGFLIGPDNGLLVPAAKSMGIINIYEISNNKMFLKNVSSTFHGRDIYAPIAAAISKNPRRIENVGYIMDSAPFEISNPSLVVDDAKIAGTIMHIDQFGNLITNVPFSIFRSVVEELGKTHEFSLQLKENKFPLKLFRAYAETDKGQLMALISSSGHLEFAVSQGSALRELDVTVGDTFKFWIRQ